MHCIVKPFSFWKAGSDVNFIDEIFSFVLFVKDMLKCLGNYLDLNRVKYVGEQRMV
jgi:hypothetical protein